MRTQIAADKRAQIAADLRSSAIFCGDPCFPRPTRRGRCVSGSVAASLLILAAAVTRASAEPASTPEDRETVVSKEVTGEVGYVGKRAISVEFARTADAIEEMLLPVNAETKVELLRSLGELKRGDTVRVQYDQTLQEREGGQQAAIKTVATKVTLVRRAPPPGTLQSKSETTTP